MQEQDALAGMVPKSEVGDRGGLTVLDGWLQAEGGERPSALLSVTSLVASGRPPTGQWRRKTRRGCEVGVE